jgi:hypothetical protein
MGGDGTLPDYYARRGPLKPGTQIAGREVDDTFPPQSRKFMKLEIPKRVLLQESRVKSLALLAGVSAPSIEGAIRTWAPKAQFALLPLREGHTAKEAESHATAWEYLRRALQQEGPKR